MITRRSTKIKIIPAGIVFLIGMFVLAAAYCQESTMTVRGEVAAVDWVGSTIAVRWFNAETGNNDEMTFLVPKSAKIFKGTAQIGLFDVNQSDRVAVVYSDDSLAGLKATSITVTD